MTIPQALKALEAFQGDSLTLSLAHIEASIIGLNADKLGIFCATRSIDASFMSSAASVKKVAGQINVIIHAAGILCALPHILNPDEKIKNVSLGAGNTGRKFDLETDQRIAEFKFIDWQGGPESIRQNSLFKDFYGLAEEVSTRKKYLYVLGSDIPLRFLNGRRALTSVLSRFPNILQQINEKYYGRVTVVRDYFQLKQSDVEIVDVSRFIGRDV